MTGSMTGKVRIIGGRWRGRKLTVADAPGLRPTGDRARETLFNWLQHDIAGAHCLDLFAGSGALGLEAASRGAASVVLIERDRRLAQALENLAREWPGGEAVRVVHADALRWLEQTPGSWDIVMIDPPFDAALHQPALEALKQHGKLAANARVYLESGARADFEPGADWEVLKDKRMGEVRLQLLRSSGDQTQHEGPI